jgi:molecular chaperone DnaK (HSP70)
MRLGIDFGTTRTVVAAEESGNYPVCTFSWNGELKEYIPSLVAVKDGSLVFGWAAVDLLGRPEVDILRSMKRLTGHLRPEDPVEIGRGFTIPILDLVTRFLAHVKWMIARHSNLTLKRRERIDAMVATPANANSNQRYITFEAFRNAGYGLLGAINEPSAAAVEFLQRYLKNLGPRSPKKYVVVYDLGGGTFDTSIVGIAGRNHDVLAQQGISRLGGDDFDEIILELMLAEIGRKKEDLTPTEIAILLEECRERKEGLKANTRKMVVDPAAVFEGHAPAVIETAILYERCQDLIRQSLDSVQSLLANLNTAGIDLDDVRSLASVYLVGGSVAFPPVSRSLRELFSSKVKQSPFPHASTAIGLAMVADPEARIRIQETVSRYFGIWRERGQDKIFDPIFLKDRQVDSESGHVHVSRTYHPVHNIGLLRFLECSAIGREGEPAGDISVWKDIYFPYDPSLSDRPDVSRLAVEPRPDLFSQKVVKTYDYDAQGIIRVEIENRTAGYRKLFKLEPRVGSTSGRKSKATA